MELVPDLVAVFLNSRGFLIRPSRLIAMATVSWLTSILALFMFWFSKWL